MGYKITLGRAKIQLRVQNLAEECNVWLGGAIFHWGAQIIKSQGAHFDGVKFWGGSAAKYCNLV